MSTETYVGQRFGRYVVTAQAPARGDRKRRWLCLCDCGRSSVVRGDTLRTGLAMSCGCGVARVLRHGDAAKGRRTKEYRAWRGILTRCENHSCHNYARYGGRGISVCETWHQFENFLADMGRAPSPAHSIDRYPNNDGNYEPGNCRWATQAEQANNTATNIYVKFNGRTLTLKQWSIDRGIHYRAMMSRYKRGWPAAQLLGFESR